MKTALLGGRWHRLRRLWSPPAQATLNLARNSDAVLFGAVRDCKYGKLDRPLRSEHAILDLPKGADSAVYSQEELELDAIADEINNRAHQKVVGTIHAVCFQ